MAPQYGTARAESACTDCDTVSNRVERKAMASSTPLFEEVASRDVLGFSFGGRSYAGKLHECGVIVPARWLALLQNGCARGLSRATTGVERRANLSL